jgi:hypothetical protein
MNLQMTENGAQNVANIQNHNRNAFIVTLTGYGEKNMTRLIDADTLVCKFINFELTNGIHCEIDKYAISVINEQPTIDAEPVRHGKWIGYAGTIGNECSVCGKWIDVLQGTAEMNYCPNCGARMYEE